MTDRKEIEKLIDQELKEANEKYPLFHSPHEAYAVLLEEVDELKAEIVGIGMGMDGVWSCVRYDADITEDMNCIYNNAMFAIQEAIQVAAMAKKAKDSMVNWK